MKELALSDSVGTTGLFTDGDWVESKDQDPNGEVRLIQLADIGVGCFLDKSARFLTIETARKLRCTYLSPGDLLIARMPDPIGRACIFPNLSQQCATVVDVCVLRPDPEILDTCYAKWMINSPLFLKKINGFVSGTTRKRISRSNLAALSIPVPPLNEQKRIAAILDQADVLRRKRQHAIDRLNQLGQAIFYEMFGDLLNSKKGLASLGDVCDVRDGTHDSPKYVDEGLPLLTSKNFSAGHIDYNGVKFISRNDFEQINKRSKVDNGDIVMPMIGTIGSPVIIDFEPDFAIKNLALIKFLGSEMNAEFVRQVLDGPLFKRHVSSKGRGGTQKFVSLGDIRTFQIPVPDSRQQVKFSEKIQKVRGELAKQLAASDYLGQLFASLQHRAFRGEL